MAYSKLAAAEKGVSLYEHIAHATSNKPRLPVIYANVINGGRHAGTALKMQEFMIVPRAKTFVEAVEAITQTYHALHDLIAERYGGAATGVGDEGGFAPPLRTAEEALTLLREATKQAKTKMWYAMDAAASEFYDEQTQKYTPIEPIDAASLAGYYEALIGDFGVISLEDPFEEHAFNDFALLRERLAKSKLECQVVGDDLTVTNPARIEQAIDAKSCDCLLLKVNQIGTVSEALEAAAKAKAAGWKVMVSHRSGETDDAYIAHLAVGLGCGQIKIGAPARGERVAKYNELLRIAEHVHEYQGA
jgi:enolase